MTHRPVHPFATGRVATAALVCLGAFGALAGCRSAPAPIPASGHLSLQLSFPGASVVLDERPLLAPRQDGTLRVPVYVGAHRVEVYAPGYFTAYRDVQVTVATDARVAVTLRPDPDAAIDTAPARPLGPRTTLPDPPP